MEDLSIREARAKLGEIIDRIKEGEAISIKGVEIGLVHSGTQLKEESGTQLVHRMSDEEIERVAERFADLIYPKLNTHNNGNLNNSKESDFKERREKAILKAVEIKPEFPVVKCGVCQRPADMPVEVEESKLWGDNGREGWIVVCKACTLGNPSRPYVAQEEVKLETYDTGFKMNERATTMNDGNKPIPKPVKKKKNEK
jgi:hypothetical protein